MHDGLPEAPGELLLEKGDDLVASSDDRTGRDGPEAEDGVRSEHLAKRIEAIGAKEREVPPRQAVEIRRDVVR
jgi:hypothetical protein